MTTPNTPDELLRLQQQSDYLRQMLELRRRLQPSPVGDLDLAIALVGAHHDSHREMIDDLVADATIPRGDIVTWAEDAERPRTALDMLRAVAPPEPADGDEEVPA